MEHTKNYPWIEGIIKPGSKIVFHLDDTTHIGAHIHNSGEFVMLDSHPHTVFIVDKIFKAFHTPININREDIWPCDEHTLALLKSWKIKPTIEESNQSLTNNTKQNVTFELQNQRADFRRTEVPRGNIICGRITEAAISIRPLSHTKISY